VPGGMRNASHILVAGCIVSNKLGESAGSGPYAVLSAVSCALALSACVAASNSETIIDNDADSYAVDTDCDDNDPAIHPGASDIPGNGVDEDCDGFDLPADCPDADHDGAFDEACGGTDCDDGDDSAYPGASERCEDGIDQDCLGGDRVCAPCSEGPVLESGCLCGETRYDRGHCCDGTWQSAGCTGDFVVLVPLALDSSSVRVGDTLTGSVTYQNAGATPLTVNGLVIACVAPDGSWASGPYHNMAPVLAPTQVEPGATLTLEARLTLTAPLPLGAWQCNSAYQDAESAWHGGPAVGFTLRDAPPVCDADVAVPATGCLCGGTPATDGFCCSDAWQDTACSACTTDYDDDGYVDAACGGNDCDDHDSSTHPGATDVCGDTFDQDCVGGDAACPACSESVVGRCSCGGSTVSSGYCCSGTPSGSRCASAPDCATASLRTANVYYYCDCDPVNPGDCVAGDDGRDGLSPETARRSFANAVTRFNTMPAGGTIAFCRGGVWSAASIGSIANGNCRANDTCDWRDYTPAGMQGAARPIVQFGTLARGFLVGQVSGLRLWNLDLRGASRATGGVMIWASGPTTDMDVCNTSLSYGDAGVVEQASNQRVTIRNSQFLHFRNQGILAGSVDLLIDSNYFSDAGATAGSRYHTIYVQGGSMPPWPSDGVHNTDGVHAGGYWNERVINNEIHVGTEASLPCNGTVIVAHGRHWDTIVRNNYIYAHSATAGCYAIGVGGGQGGGGYVDAVWMMRAVVDRNWIYAEGSGEGVSVGTCWSCSITNNSIVLTARNSDYGWRGIAVGDTTAARPGLTPPEQPNDAVVVQNNSIYTGDRGAQGGVVIMGDEGANYVVENNATWGMTTAWNSGTGCHTSSRPLLRPMAGNYCGSTAVPVASVFRDWNSNDLRPAAGSPIVGCGSSANYSPTALDSTWSPTGTGVARTAPIDAGAFVH